MPALIDDVLLVAGQRAEDLEEWTLRRLQGKAPSYRPAVNLWPSPPIYRSPSLAVGLIIKQSGLYRSRSK
jgi:hypothetical protein